MFLTNVQLAYIEQSKEYKEFVSFIETALLKQWEEFVESPFFVEAYTSINSIDEGDMKNKTVIAALVAYLISGFKQVSTLADYGDKKVLYDHLVYSANKAGQYVMDVISDHTGTSPKVFSLTDEQVLGSIQDRVDGLYEILDNTSAKEIATKLKNEARTDTRSIVIASLLVAGKEIAKRRSKNIALSETLGIYEATKQRAAAVNGIENIQWVTTGDERVCPECSSNAGQITQIGNSFNSGATMPPAHMLCRCQVIVLPETSYISSIVKKFIGSPSQFYAAYPVEAWTAIINPNAVWAGGEELVGKDKKVGFYAQNINWDNLAKNLVRLVDGKLLLDTYIEEGDISKSQELLVEARKTLTDIGFLQVVRYLGYKGAVNTYKGREAPQYPIRGYTELDKRIAQDKVYQTADEKDNIQLVSLGYKVLPKPKGLWEEPVEKMMSPEAIRFSKQTLKGKRVVSIIDNFLEAQKRGGGAIAVYHDVLNGRYIVGDDGNHRLFAALTLDIPQVAVKVYEPRIQES